MARDTTHYDRARGLVDELHELLPASPGWRAATHLADEQVVALALVESLLAIAEALHGVVYVANANAV